MLLGSLALALSAKPLLGALHIAGSERWIAWSEGVIYGLSFGGSSGSNAGPRSRSGCRPLADGGSAICSWQVPVKSITSSGDARLRGVSLGKGRPAMTRRRRPEGGPGDGDDVSDNVAITVANLWLAGGALLSLSAADGSVVGDVWTPPQPPSGGAISDWVAVPGEGGSATLGRGGASATVVGSGGLTVMGAVPSSQSAAGALHGEDDCKAVTLQAWDPQASPRGGAVWQRQVGGEPVRRTRRVAGVHGLLADLSGEPAAESKAADRPQRSLPADRPTLAAFDTVDPSAQCGSGRRAALAVSHDQTILYAADVLSGAAGGYHPSGYSNDRTAPNIVALAATEQAGSAYGPHGGEKVWLHAVAGAGTRVLDIEATPLPNVKTPSMVVPGKSPTAAVVYYSAITEVGALSVVGLNASGGVAWTVSDRVRLAAHGGSDDLAPASGLGAITQVGTGAVVGYGSDALWLVGGAQQPHLWLVTGLVAPVVSAVTGTDRLFIGLGVACDTCGLFGEPTGARLVAVSTVPLPPPPPRKDSVVEEIFEVVSKHDEFCIKTRNFVFKTRNCVSKTRNCVF